MASIAPYPNPCLVAILLVIQTRSGSGASLVFHYPPEPLSGPESSPDRGENGAYSNDQTSSSSSDDESSTEEEVGALKAGYRDTNRQEYGARAALTDEDDEEQRSGAAGEYNTEEWKPSWEPLLGLGSNGLAGLLAAGRIWHKRKFELSINDLCFLGWPVFVREDGSWKRHRSHRVDQAANSVSEHVGKAVLGEAVANRDEEEATSEATDAEGTERSKKSKLTMFNVVFVLDPPTLEYNLRVRDMYHHIVKKFTRALKYEQSRNDFIWKESEVIQSITSRHISQCSSSHTLYSELLPKSTLASAIATLYKTVSASRIASVSLSSTTSISLQIPPITSISVLPALTDPPVPAGLWLTTFNDAPPTSEDVDGFATASPAQLVTLLLKETPQRIIKDAQATGGPLALPLSTFVAAINPRKSFQKIHAASRISLGDIQLLAHHLIYWRRAIAIPPLHHRNTYIVSPNADMAKLKSACKAYETVFSTLPGLAKMLGALGESPRPWGTLLPSADHKEAYYQVLAWLMKGGWVTELRTFAFVRVGPEIKKAVRLKESQEKQEKGPEETKSFDSQTADTNDQADEPSQRRPSLMSRPSSDPRSMQTKDKSQHDPNAASLILNPSRASPLESKWLDHIAETFLTTNYTSRELKADEKVALRKYWLRFLKYFNGSEPLEVIPAREGLKRAFVWDLLGKMGLDFDGGIENEGSVESKNENGKILVAVRHW